MPRMSFLQLESTSHFWTSAIIWISFRVGWFPMWAVAIPLKSTNFLSWMIHLDSSQYGTTNGLLCLFRSSAASHEIFGTSARNFHHRLGVRVHALCSKGRFPNLILFGVMGKIRFQAWPSCSSNQPGVSVGAALIWAIISSRITTTRFLY